MNGYVALLRGVNVSGKNRIKMADLRLNMERLGAKNVSTYIQSGNLVFNHDPSNTQDIKKELGKMLLEEHGVDTVVFLYSSAEFIKIAQDNSFLESKGIDEKQVGIVFLEEIPGKHAMNELEQCTFKNESLIVRDRHICIHCRAGFGRAEVTNNFLEKRLAVKATTRNARTVKKLVQLVQELPG
ncbi:DUF1697 domain-containing protein [Zeaxanthinibacter enoshimensis]|uniref:Uncharacterized protein (DUF1697 family) n=1 Tax=Zeaxanthinibacter enoshimensis TaxID=392009 RepID=A0A4R6TNX4_9FLAO|nr:DUF1697 domain-containing protein [Zeaxanthinibacter enoshimensis]TDQ33274.1 uncharacterized protein (DUF1697 family) [Zeaxanthinibacter enoshimensis]